MAHDGRNRPKPKNKTKARQCVCSDLVREGLLPTTRAANHLIGPCWLMVTHGLQLVAHWARKDPPAAREAEPPTGPVVVWVLGFEV